MMLLQWKWAASYLLATKERALDLESELLSWNPSFQTWGIRLSNSVSVFSHTTSQLVYYLSHVTVMKFQFKCLMNIVSYLKHHRC